MCGVCIHDAKGVDTHHECGAADNYVQVSATSGVAVASGEPGFSGFNEP
jgi:hypothetical protein